jgi:hypothetical protein
MMGLVMVLKSTKIFSEFTTAQLQAMIHDIAVQEIRGSNTVLIYLNLPVLIHVLYRNTTGIFEPYINSI